MEKCPMCSTEYDDAVDEVLECPRCGLPGATLCCIPGGRHTICVDCEQGPEQPRVPSIEELARSYARTQKLPPYQLVAKLFAGNCHSVSLELVKLMGPTARVVRGHWHGPSANRPGFPIQQHSWVECGEFYIDPTRFVFEGVEPYIYVALKTDCPHYDPGSIRVREEIKEVTGRTKMPAREDTPTTEPSGLSVEARMALTMAFAVTRDWRSWTYAERMFIANTDPARLEPHAKEIFAAIRKVDRAAIPYDVREMLGIE